MKKLYFLSFSFLTVCWIAGGVNYTVFAQGWERTYGGSSTDIGSDVQQTNDGGYIAAGYTSSFGAAHESMYLIKTNSTGDTLWTKICVGANNYHANCVQQTNDGGYIVAGSDLIKTDANGNVLWNKDMFGYSVRQTPDEGYIIASSVMPSWNIKTEACLIKTDANGDTIWMKTYGGNSWDYVFDVRQTIDGGYIATGNTVSFGAGDADVYLIKTDANGNALWTKTFGGAGEDISNCVNQTSDGGYIVAGSTQSFGAGSKDIYLVKTDANGNAIWTKTYGGTSWDGGASVEQTTDGGFIVAGGTWSFGEGNNGVFLIKTHANGDALWTKTFGGSHYDSGNSVHQTTDGGYIVAGSVNSLGGEGYDVYLIKTDSEGNICTPGSFSQNFTLCYGDSLIVGSNIYFTSGTYIDTLTNANGCDSIIFTYLTIIFPPYNTYSNFASGEDSLLNSPDCDIFNSNSNESPKHSLIIIPNPSSGKFSIHSSGKIFSIVITDLVGKKVYQANPKNQKEDNINLSNQQKGIYMVEAISESEIYQKKIILQ